jgi:hypothetical protein
MYDINLLNDYLGKSGIKTLDSDRIIGLTIYVQATLSEWFRFLKYVVIYLQNDKGPTHIAQILL